MIDIMRWLEKHGANVDTPNKWDNTALLSAASYGFEDVVKVLIQMRADPTIKNAYGQTAKEWAGVKEHTSIMELLEEYETDFEGLVEGDENLNQKWDEKIETSDKKFVIETDVRCLCLINLTHSRIDPLMLCLSRYSISLWKGIWRK